MLFDDIFDLGNLNDLGFEEAEEDLKPIVKNDTWDTGHIEDVWRTNSEPWNAKMEEEDSC